MPYQIIKLHKEIEPIRLEEMRTNAAYNMNWKPVKKHRDYKGGSNVQDDILYGTKLHLKGKLLTKMAVKIPQEPTKELKIFYGLGWGFSRKYFVQLYLDQVAIGLKE